MSAQLDMTGAELLRKRLMKIGLDIETQAGGWGRFVGSVLSFAWGTSPRPHGTCGMWFWLDGI